MSDSKPNIIEVSGVAHRASKIGVGVERPETGAMQFGEDWPGLFLRGDSAIYFQEILKRALECMEEGRAIPMHDVTQLRALRDFLGLPSGEDVSVQALQGFEACKDSSGS